MASTRKNPPRTRKTAAPPPRKSQARRQAEPPPVMARSYRMDVPFQVNRPHTKKARRRYDVSLGVPGAEMRLPSLPVLRITRSWILLLLVIVLLGGLYFLWNAPPFQVQAAQVEGLKRVNSNDVNAVLDVSGKPVFSLFRTDLSGKLEAAFPEFSSASVQISLPNTVRVQVTEREPVLTWRQGDSLQLVDNDGYAFPLRLAASTVISPVIEASGSPVELGITEIDVAAYIAASTKSEQDPFEAQAAAPEPIEPLSDESKPFIKPQTVAAILSVSRSVPSGAVLIYDPTHGLGWQDERGWQVYVGDDQDIAMKLLVYEALVQRLVSDEIQPELVSVEHVHNPYYRLAQ